MVLATAGWRDLSRATASMSRRALAGDRNDDYVPVRINSKSGTPEGLLDTRCGRRSDPLVKPSGRRAAPLRRRHAGGPGEEETRS